MGLKAFLAKCLDRLLGPLERETRPCPAAPSQPAAGEWVLFDEEEDSRLRVSRGTATGKWVLFDKTNLRTDDRMFTVSLQSSSYSPALGDKTAWLGVGCRTHREDNPYWFVWILWCQYVNNPDDNLFVEVVTCYGREAAGTEDWYLARSGEATHIPVSQRRGGDKSEISKLQEVDRLEARVVTVDGVTLTATWDVRGLREALAPVVAEFGEPPG